MFVFDSDRLLKNFSKEKEKKESNTKLDIHQTECYKSRRVALRRMSGDIMGTQLMYVQYLSCTFCDFLSGNF
jgi:hypothetical protein